MMHRPNTVTWHQARPPPWTFHQATASGAPPPSALTGDQDPFGTAQASSYSLPLVTKVPVPAAARPQHREARQLKLRQRPSANAPPRSRGRPPGVRSAKLASGPRVERPVRHAGGYDEHVARLGPYLKIHAMRHPFREKVSHTPAWRVWRPCSGGAGARRVGDQLRGREVVFPNLDRGCYFSFLETPCRRGSTDFRFGALGRVGRASEVDAIDNA
ncbi:hypothetical protein VUR80DRAFT_1324 [Thermomyces stellatus]